MSEMIGVLDSPDDPFRCKTGGGWMAAELGCKRMEATEPILVLFPADDDRKKFRCVSLKDSSEADA